MTKSRKGLSPGKCAPRVRLILFAYVFCFVPPTSCLQSRAAGHSYDTQALEASAATSASWIDDFIVSAFIDTYYQLNYNFPKPDRNTIGRVFDRRNGFSLGWTGVDIHYPAAPVGATVALRLGPAAGVFARNDSETSAVLEAVKEAFIVWKPFPFLSLNLGKFETIYGSEPAESQRNFNYSRSVSTGFGLPFHHTGLRVSADLIAGLRLNFLVVNGWDRTLDNNTMKSFGFQIQHEAPRSEVVLGYLFGPEGSESGPAPSGVNRRFRHLIDAVARWNPSSRMAFVGSTLLGLEARQASDTAAWYGAALVGHFNIDSFWAAALRGEYFGDPDGVRVPTSGNVFTTGVHLMEWTATVDLKLYSHFLLRLENRFDWASERIYREGDSDRRSTRVTTTVAAVLYGS